MGDHEQRLVAASEEAFEPLYHLQVEVVGGLVEYQQVGFRNQYVGQGHPFLLSAAELSHRFLQVGDFQLRQNLLGFQYLFGVAPVVEAGFEHRLFRRESRTLLQIAQPQVVLEDDVALILALLARDDAQQCRLAGAVLRHKPYALALGN